MIVYGCVWMCMDVYGCIRMYMDVWMYMDVYGCVYVSLYLYLYIYTHLDVYIQVARVPRLIQFMYVCSLLLIGVVPSYVHQWQECHMAILPYIAMLPYKAIFSYGNISICMVILAYAQICFRR